MGKKKQKKKAEEIKKQITKISSEAAQANRETEMARDLNTSARKHILNVQTMAEELYLMIDDQPDKSGRRPLIN